MEGNIDILLRDPQHILIKLTDPFGKFQAGLLLQLPYKTQADICCLFLDRKDLRSGVRMIKDGAELIKKGHSMVICPEGTRNQNKEMLPFKEGSLKMADRADCPVVPVAIIDSDQMLEIRPGFHIKSGNPKVIYGKAFYLKDLDKEDKKHAGVYVQNIIKNMIDGAGGQTA